MKTAHDIAAGFASRYEFGFGERRALVQESDRI